MKTMKSLNFLSAGELILLEHNIQGIASIYTNVLKHGYSIEIDKIDRHGSYSFRMSRQNPNWDRLTEDWQFHELPFIQHSYVVLHAIGSKND